MIEDILMMQLKEGKDEDGPSGNTELDSESTITQFKKKKKERD